MAQLIRVCITPAEDLSPVPATHAKQIYFVWLTFSPHAVQSHWHPRFLSLQHTLPYSGWYKFKDFKIKLYHLKYDYLTVYK